MTKIVYFHNQGRFTNNLFQYFAAEIFKKIYNYDEVKISKTRYHNSNTVYDHRFTQIIRKYINGEIDNSIDTNNHIYLDGFFQRTEIYVYLKEYIYSLFTKENTHYFNDTYRICDIVPDTTDTINSNDLTLHIRLDDFINDVQIFEPSELKERIDKIMKENSLEKLYIVCDKLKQEWEFKYMTNFMDLDPIFIRGSVVEDFHYMMKSSYLFASASTLSWMAGFLGHKYNPQNKLYIPLNKIFINQEGCQKLVGFDENCQVFNDLNYIKK